MIDVSDPYQFRNIAHDSAPTRGQIWRAPAVYLTEWLEAVKLTRYEPSDETQNRYQLLREPMGMFDHPPVHEIHLLSDEEIIAVKAKKRPVLVLSEAAPTTSYSGGRPVEECYVVAPLYSFHSTDSREFKDRIAAHEYPQWVYLPEGYMRLDRLQVVARRLMEPAHIVLSNDAMFVVGAWLRYYLLGEIDTFWLEYRQDLLNRHRSSYARQVHPA